MAVPPIIDTIEFEAVQTLLKTRSPALTAPRIVSGPTLLTGICFCAACGMAMTLRTGKGGALPLLHLLDQSPAGRDRLRGPHGADGQAGYAGCRPHRAPATAARPAGADPVVGARPPPGARRAPNIAYRRIAQARGGGGRQTQAPLRRDRERRRRRLRSDAQGSRGPSSGPSATRPAPTRSGPRVRSIGSGRASRRRR